MKGEPIPKIAQAMNSKRFFQNKESPNFFMARFFFINRASIYRKTIKDKTISVCQQIPIKRGRNLNVHFGD